MVVVGIVVQVVWALAAVFAYLLSDLHPVTATAIANHHHLYSITETSRSFITSIVNSTRAPYASASHSTVMLTPRQIQINPRCHALHSTMAQPRPRG